MITIPTLIRTELITLDRDLQRLGRQLYGRKTYGDYSDGDYFCNFRLELHLNGRFSLHFLGGIMGSIDHHDLGFQETSESAILEELHGLHDRINHQMQLVNA